jgi:hypothetical protein
MSDQTRIALRWSVVLAVMLALASAEQLSAQQPVADAKPTLEVYGFGQADAIVDFKQNNPDWYDVSRPSRLPSFANEFGEDGHFYLSARQSRFGARGTLPTANGDVRATFEFDMFGVGPDAGVTTIRLRHAWGQWKQIGGGQTNSQFMDVDVFPNSLDYWGPNGMLFFRNVQVFWEPYSDGDSHARLAIENPGASGDAGRLAERIELQNVQGRFPAPDVTGHYRAAFVKASPSDVLRLQFIYGAGIQNYFNDAPVDVGIESNPGNATTPVVGMPLPIVGLVAFLDHNWTRQWSTAVGYSLVNVDNSNLQSPDAFKVGQYSLVNLLCAP